MKKKIDQFHLKYGSQRVTKYAKKAAATINGRAHFVYSAPQGVQKWFRSISWSFFPHLHTIL